jgi:Protein of unknown function (DUF2804)
MLEGLPQRGAEVRKLGLPVPPDPMPRRRGTRPLKRWRYIGAYCDEVMLCVGEVRVGPLPQRFWALAEPGRPVAERTTVGRGGVRIHGSHAHVHARDVRIDLEVDEDAGVESIHPSGRDGYVWTRKQAAVPARAEVRVGGRMFSLACDAVIDDTAGYHQRHTSWTWSAGVGTGTRGERIGWNLVTGVNDSEQGSERAVWVDGVPFEPPPVTFADDLSRIEFSGGDGALDFSEWSAREDRTNVLLVRSSYRQPFGTFTGSFPGGVQLERGCGVVEVHDVHW